MPTSLFPQLTTKQNEYLQALISQKYKFLLYGGAVGGGKTFLTLGILNELCSTYENVRFAVVRKSLTTIKKNTIPSYFKVLDHAGMKLDRDINLKRTEWYAEYFKTGSRIDFIDADQSKDPQLNKLKGLELTGALIEECNEIEQEAFEVLKTRIGRWRNEETQIRAFIMLTCNPDNNWVKSMFYDPWKSNHLPRNLYYLPALPKDNPYLGDDYMETLETMPPAQYARYALGDWDYIVDKNQLIQTIWMTAAVIDINEEDLRQYSPKYLGIDFAREGDDGTVLAFGDDDHLLWTERFDNDRTGPVADRIEEVLDEYPELHMDLIATDAIGNGSALIDVLEERGIYIGSFKSSETSLRILRAFTFKNRRMEAYWLFREAVRKGDLKFNHNSRLIRQSQVAKYFTNERCMQLDTKDNMKKALGGVSPDELDAAVIMNYVREENINCGDIRISSANTRRMRKDKKTLGRKKYHSTLVKEMVY